MLEVTKYQDIYEHPDEYPNYGRHNHGKGIFDLMDFEAVESICDLGCGLGDFCIQCADIGIKDITGIDFAAPFPDDSRIKWIRCSMDILPFKDKSIDYLTAFDSLEHLIPEEVDTVLSEMNRVTKIGFVLSITYKPAICTKYILHPTVRPEAWWVNKLEKYGSVFGYNNYLFVTLCD